MSDLIEAFALYVQAKTGRRYPAQILAKALHKANTVYKDSRDAALPAGEDDVPSKPDPVDEKLWAECKRVGSAPPPAQLPGNLGKVGKTKILLVDGARVKVDHYLDF